MTDATLNESNIDDLSRMLMALAQEVWIMRDRMAITEKLLEDRAGITAAEIDDYTGDAQYRADLEKMRELFARRVIGAPLAARERGVDQILRRAGLASRAETKETAE